MVALSNVLKTEEALIARTAFGASFVALFEPMPQRIRSRIAALAMGGARGVEAGRR
ncbi:hypothetical protein OE699_10520 [Sedimentimonas flavescens]|uniref:Uncharacterized protein n=1 Tax=Sedimentimonas flavescens TaxID=2851012 RepID=A0ABT3A044_9RHOB|nr:hypothetical protein [Sedimentimonas flavescens]